jgi:hypothetical protein
MPKSFTVVDTDEVEPAHYLEIKFCGEYRESALVQSMKVVVSGYDSFHLRVEQLTVEGHSFEHHQLGRSLKRLNVPLWRGYDPAEIGQDEFFYSWFTLNAKQFSKLQ